MSLGSKREYREAIYPTYKAASRGQKKIILMSSVQTPEIYHA